MTITCLYSSILIHIEPGLVYWKWWTDISSTNIYNRNYAIARSVYVEGIEKIWLLWWS